jgi:hypothetical protein
MLIDVAISGDKCDQERSRENVQLSRPHNKNSANLECEIKSDTSNNRGNWKHFKITQTMHDKQQESTKLRKYKKQSLGTAPILWKV